MPMVVANGALALLREHGIDAVELVRENPSASYVGAAEAKAMLRRREILPPEAKSKASMGEVHASRTKRVDADRENVQHKTPNTARNWTFSAMAVTEEHADSEEDIPLLDGNRIRIEWPQTRPGRKTRMRARIGTVRFIHKKERHKEKHAYLVEFERNPQRNPTLGVRLRKTSWKKLSSRARKLDVISSSYTRPEFSRWTEQEEGALKRRVLSGERHGSVAVALGRSRSSVGQKVAHLLSGKYEPQSKGAKRQFSGVSVLLVERAMMLLLREGTWPQVCVAVKELARRDGIPLDCSKTPGAIKMMRWEKSVSDCLRQSLIIQRTGAKVKHSGRNSSALYKCQEPSEAEPAPSLIDQQPHVKFYTPNVGGPKKSERIKRERHAGGDLRHGTD